MRFKKQFITGNLPNCVLAIALLFAGCSKHEEPSAVTPEAGFIVVTDLMGRQVKIKEDIEHVGSLFAVASHIVAMLGEADSIVTIPQGNVRDLLFCEIYPEILNARIAKRGNVISIEEIAKKPRPEVFIVNPEVAHDKGQMGLLEKLRTPVLAIAYRNMEQQMEAVELVGQIIGQPEKAGAYRAYYQKTIDLVSSRVSKIPETERQTVYHAINELLRTDQPETLSADWINCIGVENTALSDADRDGFPFNKNYMALEELLEKNPEHILINGGDVYDYIENSPQLHNLKAFRNGNIHLLPLGISRWGHPYSIETPLAMLWAAKKIYPAYFDDIDIGTETRSFYRTFFNYELSDDQLAKILSGRGYKEIKGSGR